MKHTHHIEVFIVICSFSKQGMLCTAVLTVCLHCNKEL